MANPSSAAHKQPPLLGLAFGVAATYVAVGALSTGLGWNAVSKEAKAIDARSMLSHYRTYSSSLNILLDAPSGRYNWPQHRHEIAREIVNNGQEFDVIPFRGYHLDLGAVMRQSNIAVVPNVKDSDRATTLLVDAGHGCLGVDLEDKSARKDAVTVAAEARVLLKAFQENLQKGTDQAYGRYTLTNLGVRHDPAAGPAEKRCARPSLSQYEPASGYLI